MKTTFTILAVTTDFGKLSDGKPWKGCRVCIAERRFNDETDEFESQRTYIAKSAVEISLNCVGNTYFDLYFNQQGKLCHFGDLCD